MATEIDLLKAEIARIERELQDAKRKLARATKPANDSETGPLSDLRGVLKGKVHFTEEDIAALKVGGRDLD